ncbi:MAG TPA: sulfurtransferase TusA family protein [Actinomycetales bacterium]|nr:sulfurtransferase TusA family protein [Actinomycetales bacterium]
MANKSETATVTLLDNRSTPCAIGLIKADRTMREIASGHVLEIWSRDRYAPMEVPIWAQREGHLVLIQERAGHWPRKYWRFQIVRL